MLYDSLYCISAEILSLKTSVGVVSAVMLLYCISRPCCSKYLFTMSPIVEAAVRLGVLEAPSDLILILLSAGYSSACSVPADIFFWDKNMTKTMTKTVTKTLKMKRTVTKTTLTWHKYQACHILWCWHRLQPYHKIVMVFTNEILACRSHLCWLKSSQHQAHSSIHHNSTECKYHSFVISNSNRCHTQFLILIQHIVCNILWK